MIRMPNFNSMTIPCSRRNGDAKLMKPSLLEKVQGKLLPEMNLSVKNVNMNLWCTFNG